MRLGLAVYGHRRLGISLRTRNKPARHRESGEVAAWKLPEHITDPLRCASCMIMIGSDSILLFSDSCSIESRFLSLLAFHLRRTRCWGLQTFDVGDGENAASANHSGKAGRIFLYLVNVAMGRSLSGLSFWVGKGA